MLVATQSGLGPGALLHQVFALFKTKLGLHATQPAFPVHVCLLSGPVQESANELLRVIDENFAETTVVSIAHRL